jgi:hypothetical protein
MSPADNATRENLTPARAVDCGASKRELLCALTSWQESVGVVDERAAVDSG